METFSGAFIMCWQEGEFHLKMFLQKHFLIKPFISHNFFMEIQ